MLGAALLGRRGVFLLVAALAALAALPTTSQAATSSSQSLVDVWALEVTPRFAPAVNSRFVSRAKERGINTIVLNHDLSGEQKRRVRSLADRFHLRVVRLRRVVCKHKVTTCAVVARRPAAVGRLSRNSYVDIVVLRLRGPRPVARLARRHARAVSGTASAQLLLLPTLRPPFSRASWRRAISAVADAQPVALGVRLSGRSSTRAFKLFLDLLRTHVSSAPGAVVFKGDFETGDVSQWTWGAQCANTSSASMLFTRGTVTVQADVVGEGAHAARFDLPAAPSDRTACEVLSPRPIGVGTSDYYGLMVRFPTDWREPSPPSWGLGIAQLNYEGIWGAPVTLSAYADTVALVLQSGPCNSVYTSNPGCRNSSGLGGNLPRMYAVPAPLALGVWHELIVHVRWATDSSGLVDAWHRLKGSSSWTKTVSLTGYPTLEWTTDTGPEGIVSRTTADKIGAYRGNADFPLSVWHDGFVRTTSFASAASSLP